MKILIPRHLSEPILNIKYISHSIFSITVKSAYIAKNAAAGQFISIRCTDDLYTLLRRPISICYVNTEKETFDIVVEVRGKGTKALCSKRAGCKLDFLGPLGKPFYMSSRYEKIAVVGGGIGIFPLLLLLEQSKADIRHAFLGFKDKESMVLLKEFEKFSTHLVISTDDGSYGVKGTITNVFDRFAQNGNVDIIYTCGPLPMMKKVVDIAERSGIKCQVSLEQRMGCGIGACLVCACKVRRGNDWQYGHVCKDGPVFWSDDVILEDE